MVELFAHNIRTLGIYWLLDICKVGQQTLQLNGLSVKTSSSIIIINSESENQKFGLIIIIFIFHSACPCKNYSLKCIPELKTLLYLNLLFST